MSVTDLVTFDKEPEPLWKRLFLALVILLVALLSFGVGRLTGGGKGEGIKIEYDPALSAFMKEATPIEKSQTAAAVNALKQEKISGESVVASQNGSKYHYLHCPGAKQIKEENKISFNSGKEAEASGYTLASNCKPR